MVLSYIFCDLDPKVKVIGKTADICNGVPSTAALVTFTFRKPKLLFDGLDVYSSTYICTLNSVPWQESELMSPVKYFTDRSKAVLLLWIFYVFVLSCVCYVFVHVCLYVLCGHLLGKG